MKQSKQKRQLDMLFFFGAALLSLVMLLGAVFFAKQTLSGTADRQTNSVSACLALLRQQGFAPTAQGNTIHVNRRISEGLELWVQRAGLAIAQCPLVEIQSFCVGAGCTAPGISFSLIERAR